ncbi:DNA-binding protein [Burkholderia sp. WAC0059]|uniref:DNA-binding protein n=1 Tax=Burkholderia sp. WAC0059 TaxID=2066022 RepID=UPI000C7EB438|nr:DNA-binding protein [Burkholderia sp. WAC0059]PLZ01411.1 DNA-binding protein [Burkholderia sp. WAC0059]
MDTLPDGNTEQKFRALIEKLLTKPEWTEKQQIELEMARDISIEMLRLAEQMRDAAADLETCLTLLKYAKVLDFVMSSLAARRDIKPQTLRVIFKLAGLTIDEAYPG